MSAIALHYTILAGDSYSKIAVELNSCAGITAIHIERANTGITDQNLEAGHKLIIPTIKGNTALTYTVRAGDTLETIAKGLNAASGVSIAQIESVNPGIQPTALQIGEVINIPISKKESVSTIPLTTLSTSVSAEVIGYWDWTWDHGTAIEGATLGIAFSGWADVETAIQQSKSLKGLLQGENYICLGGGNENGSFTSARLTAIASAIQSGLFNGYDGIAFDVEEGDGGLAPGFMTAFASARSAGLKVLVTVSHSTPFGISDGAELMNSFFMDENIDILSPQLYTTGKEDQNDYAISHGVEWSSYASARAAIAPSIVKASYYDDAKSFFGSQGVHLMGFIQWSREDLA